jgi:hypothetical protein
MNQKCDMIIIKYKMTEVMEFDDEVPLSELFFSSDTKEVYEQIHCGKQRRSGSFQLRKVVKLFHLCFIIE